LLGANCGPTPPPPSLCVKTYDLQSNFSETNGGLSCDTFPNPVCDSVGVSLPTTAGDFSVNSARGTRGTFCAETGAYALSISPLFPLAVVRGASATSTITIISSDGYDGTVTLSCSVAGGSVGFPPSCTVTPIFNTLTTTGGAATLTVLTGGECASGAGGNCTGAGTYSIAVTGTDCGSQAPTNGAQSVTLTVVPQPAGGGTIAVFTFAGLLALWGMVQMRRRKRDVPY
jgi:hypothetical protein